VAIVPLKRGLLAFWALYLSVVTVTNSFDALKALGVLGADWTYASGNYDAVVQALSRYPLPGVLHALAFAGVIVWEAVGAALLWRAAACYRGAAGRGRQSVYGPLAVLTGLWAAFLLVDELLVYYNFASAHRELLMASLATLLVVALVPERAE
jgi:hypothetical protein